MNWRRWIAHSDVNLSKATTWAINNSEHSVQEGRKFCRQEYGSVFQSQAVQLRADQRGGLSNSVAARGEGGMGVICPCEISCTPTCLNLIPPPLVPQKFPNKRKLCRWHDPFPIMYVFPSSLSKRWWRHWSNFSYWERTFKISLDLNVN